MMLLRKINQMKVGGKGADQPQQIAALQTLEPDQQSVLIARRGFPGAQGDTRSSNVLDVSQQAIAALLSEHVANELAEQAHVLAKTGKLFYRRHPGCLSSL